MNQTRTYRDQGAIGALLDEYERALEELVTLLKELSTDQLVRIVDTQTQDEDCRSIQTILTHVVQSGYTYVVEIRKWLGETCAYRDKVVLATAEEYIAALRTMFLFNEQLFLDYPQISLETYAAEQKIKVRWGQLYDVEQLFEHAIVHILRHRRQIERFLIRLEGPN
ncbi:MAG: DinB family protein [Bacteroidota bacterium]